MRAPMLTPCNAFALKADSRATPMMSYAPPGTRHVANVLRMLPKPDLGLALTFRPDELYRVPTDDGASIALGRYHPRGPRRFAEPVLLCHGLGANRFNLDFDERYSVARYLARRGFETWVLEMRGRGEAGFHARSTSFDEQAEHDVAA